MHPKPATDLWSNSDEHADASVEQAHKEALVNVAQSRKKLWSVEQA